LIKSLQKTPSAKGILWEEKVPFLLVRFLWANKENERYNCWNKI
jgi:hypothetical protein